MNEQGILVEWNWHDNWTTGRKTCPSATLSPTNPTWTVCLHSDRLVTNCLSHSPHYLDYKLGNCHCFGDLQATGAPSQLSKLKYWHLQRTNMTLSQTDCKAAVPVSITAYRSCNCAQWMTENLRFSQQCCCTFKSSGMCHAVSLGKWFQTMWRITVPINCITLNTKALWSFRVYGAYRPMT